MKLMNRINLSSAALLLALSCALLSGCAALVLGGAGTAVVVANDRRVADVIATDQRIELQAVRQLEHKFADADTHFNAASYNKQVLLSGETRTEAMKSEAESIVLNTPEVRSVFNELRVAPPSSFGNRSNDTYITSEVKSRMVASKKFNPFHIKVVTEAQTVYLMGIVTRQEAADATEIARNSNGVRRVVRLFEYIAGSPPATNEQKK
jgi:osmotically-inducible protein OsmY